MNNILIVEDEHLIARLIEMTLTRAGYRCTLAEDGRTAADLIETTNFDMALFGYYAARPGRLCTVGMSAAPGRAGHLYHG